MPDTLDRREYEAAQRRTEENLARLERQLEQGAALFQSLQLAQRQHASLLEGLLANQQKLEKEIGNLERDGHPLQSRMVLLESELAQLKRIPEELASLRLGFETFVARAAERDVQIASHTRRSDTWWQLALRMLIPMAFAVGGYMVSDYIATKEAVSKAATQQQQEERRQ